MADLELQALSRRVRRLTGQDTRKGILGDADGVVYEPNRAGYVRVRFPAPDGYSPYAVVRMRGQMSVDPGAAVTVGFDEDGEQAVIGIDFTGQVSQGYNPLLANAADRNINAQNTQLQIPALLSQPTMPVSTSVVVHSFIYIVNQTVTHFTGAKVDLSSYIPTAGNQRIAGLFLTSANAIEVTTSTSKTLVEQLGIADVQECVTAAAADSLPVWFWKLADNQSTIADEDSFLDGRQVISPSGTTFTALLDTNFETLASGQVAVYNQNSQKWVNRSVVLENEYPLTLFLEENAKNLDEDWLGSFYKLADAQTLSSGSPFNVNANASKLVFYINAGSTTSGTLTVTGTSIDRNTGAVTASDSQDITISGTTTDTGSTDAESNDIHGATNAYITDRWFAGTVTISTSDLVLSDVDVYQCSFEQFNGQHGITVKSFDAKIVPNNNSAWFYGYLYALKVTGSSVDIELLATLNAEETGEPIVADSPLRSRRGMLDKSLDGMTDGIFANLFFGPNNLQYWEKITITIWYSVTKTLEFADIGDVLLLETGDAVLLETGDNVLLE